MLDEDKRFDTIVIKNGVEYELFEEIDMVVIGIAWVTDFKGDEEWRTWYGADPSL